MKANAKTNCASERGGGVSNRCDFLCNQRGRLSPGEIHIGMLSRDAKRGLRRTAKVKRRRSFLRVLKTKPRTLHAQMFAREIRCLASHQGAPHREKFGSGFV